MVTRSTRGWCLPARQQRLQHAGGGRLADRDAARDADDERHRAVGVLLRLAEELGRRGEQPLPRGDLQMDQPGQRQVDLFDLEQVQLLAETAKPEEFALGELQRRRHAQRTPLTPVELDVRTRLARPRHAISLALTVDGMDATTVIREYLLLGLRFDRIEEGYVDSFTGDPALRRAVAVRAAARPRRPGPPAPSALLAELPGADGLDAAARRLPRRAPAGRWRARAASSRARTSASSRRCATTSTSTSPRATRTSTARRTASSTRRWAARGPLAERMQAHRTGEEIPPERLEECIHAFSSALRDRVRAEFPLPDAETINYEIVTDKPWSGFNYYEGDYRSTVAVNADLKQQMSNLPRLVAHESYPGSPHRALPQGGGPGRARLGQAEQTIFLVNTPQCLMAEGLADLALYAAIGPQLGRLGDRDLRRPGPALRRRAGRGDLGGLRGAGRRPPGRRADAARRAPRRRRRRRVPAALAAGQRRPGPGSRCGSCPRRCGGPTPAPTSRATGCCGAGWTRGPPT